MFHHRHEHELAQLIAKQYPRLGDRLLGAVELQNQNESSISPRLKKAAMAEVAKEINARDLENALPRSWRKRWAFSLVALVALTLAAYYVTPKASWNAFQRWLMPLAEIERYTETKIDFSKLPQPYYVAHGEAHTLTLTLTEDSNKPAQAKAQLGSREWQSSSLQEHFYLFELPPLLNEQELTLQAGDAYATLTLTPLMRPSLEQITATVEFPEYLQKENERIDLRSGQASVLQGSTLTIQGKTNRPLSKATATQKLPSQPIASGEITYQNTPLEVQTQNASFTLPPLTINQERFHLPLQWTDIHQLQSKKPTLLTIEQLIDSPPNVYLQDIAEETYVLADSSIQFAIQAEDDYGLKHVGIEWQGEFTKASPMDPAKGEIPLIQGSPNTRSLSESVDFSFPAYNIIPQKLTIRAWAEDYKTDRQRSYSSPITVYVLSQEEHRKHLEERTRSTINELEELMRTELDLLDGK